MISLKVVHKLVFVLSIIGTVIVPDKINAQGLSEKAKKDKLDSIRNNPSGQIYYFDGKQISEESFYKKAYDGELNGLAGTGGIAGKDAVTRFGERYRYGVCFFNPKGKASSYDIEKQDSILIPFKKRLSSGSRQSNEYKLNGVVNKMFDGNAIMLFSFDQDKIQNVDTAFIDNGCFEFRGKENINDIGILSIGNFPDTVLNQLVILERGNINVSVDNKRIGGSPLNDLFQSYLDTSIVFRNELQSIAKSDTNKGYIVKGTPLYKKHVEIGKYIVDFKKRNITNFVGQYFFEKEAGRGISELIAYPSQNSLDSAFFMVYNAADTLYRKKKWIGKYIESLKKDIERKRLQEEMKNNLYIDLTLKDVSGESKKISQYVGESKYTLLDFWASWCGPCIQSFGKLKEVYEKYDRKKINIIGISLDTSETDWLISMKKNQVPWVQLLTGNDELVKQIKTIYAFQAIPFTVLLDQEGKIVQNNCDIYSIDEFIKE